MESVVMWFFVALVNGQGMIGVNTSSYADCFAEYQKAEASADVLALSVCQEVKLARRIAPSERT